MAPTGKQNTENKENVSSDQTSISPEGTENDVKQSSNDPGQSDKSKNPTSQSSKQKSKAPKSSSKNLSADKQKQDGNKSSAVKRSAAQIMQNVNKALGLSKDTQNLPKIPKLTPRFPAQAAGSAQAKASDPIMHSTPIQGQGQVIYPYRPPAMSANQPQMDPVPQYLQDISNITPVHAQAPANQFNQPMLQSQNSLMQNFTTTSASGQPPAIPQQQFMFQPNQMQYQNFTPQYMGQPRTVDQSSNLVVIPTPLYPTQPYVIADRNNLVTVPLGGHQNFPQPNFDASAEQVPQNQGPLPLEPNIEEDEYEDYYVDDQELDRAVDNDIDELLNVRDHNQQEQKQDVAPVAQDEDQDDQLALDDQQGEPVAVPPVPDEFEYLEDELDNDDEEIGPPLTNNTLQRVVDGVWDQALRRPEALKMKSVYESIWRPSNISNLMKTQVNPLVKESTAREAFRNDGLPRSIQTGIIKGALSLVDVLQSVADIQVPEGATEQEQQQALADQRKSILQKGIKSVKCLAYSTTKVNSLRRRLQKPFLNRRYQRLCTRQNQPSHQWLYGDDVVEEIRSQDQANRLSRNLAPRRRNSRGGRAHNQTYPPAYRGRGGQYQYQQFQNPRQPGNVFVMPFTPTLPGMSVRYFPMQNSYQSGNFAKLIDDRHIQTPVVNMSQIMQQNMSMKNLNNNQFLCCSSSTAVQRGSQGWTSEQRQRTWPRPAEPESEPQLVQPPLMPDRSVTPVSPDYPFSLGLNFTTFQQGGLEKKLKNWRKLTSDPHILDLVQGIKLDFIEPPVQDKIPNEIKFSKEDQELVRLELDRFVDLGILEESTIQPGDFVSNLFIRHKKEPGKIRILANLKKLNSFVKHIHFKMDTLDSVIQMIRPGSFMVTIDLESSFYSLNVHPDYRKYLKVICMGKIFVFKKLPMGYAQSPLQFTKLMKIPLTYLRSEFGYTNSAFVDDLILIEDTYSFAKKSSIDTADTLQFLGYTINVPKSAWEPQQKKVHLGVILNSINMTVTLTQEKVDKLIDHAQKLLQQKHIQIRSLASLIGQMNAARYAVYYGPLHTKSLEIAKNLALAKSKGDFDALMTL